MKKSLIFLAITSAFAISTNIAFADDEDSNDTGCSLLNTAVSRDTLIQTAKGIVDGNTYLADASGDFQNDTDDNPDFDANSTTPNGGFDLPMWVTVVDNSGAVCHVINTGTDKTTDGTGQSLNPAAFVGNQSWLGSRVISAQKANTANAFSLDYYAISTANLFGTVQSNNSLFGLQESNPVDPKKAYRGNPNKYGTKGDPMKNKRIGGVNVFGGGLALYKDGNKIGAIGVSGDTSCTDHVVAWKIREGLGLDGNPFNLGPSSSMFDAAGTGFDLGGTVGDEMYMHIDNIGTSNANGWEHAACPNTPTGTGAATNNNNGGAIIGTLPGGVTLP